MAMFCLLVGHAFIGVFLVPDIARVTNITDTVWDPGVRAKMPWKAQECTSPIHTPINLPRAESPRMGRGHPREEVR